jgi:hypothetical protein
MSMKLPQYLLVEAPLPAKPPRARDDILVWCALCGRMATGAHPSDDRRLRRDAA